jgi:AraC family transcriptional regulator of adaptative response / DNA-3-methyladenine glycosylase II
VDGNEIAIRAVLGQQVSVAAARRLGARLVELCGGSHGPGADARSAEAGSGLARLDAAESGDQSLTRVFPDVAVIAALDPAVLPMPLSRARTVITLAAALAGGYISLDPGADRDDTAAQLLALPGIGAWTAGYIRMRALSDPDVFLPTDAGVLRALARLGPGRAAERWRPWRSYAVHHLWATLEEPALGQATEAVRAAV